MFIEYMNFLFFGPAIFVMIGGQPHRSMVGKRPCFISLGIVRLFGFSRECHQNSSCPSTLTYSVHFLEHNMPLSIIPQYVPCYSPYTWISFTCASQFIQHITPMNDIASLIIPSS